MPPHGGDDLRSIGFTVLTVSDTRTAADDESGDLVRRLAAAAGHRIAASAIVHDETAAIAREVTAWLSHREVLAVVLTGGTGVAPRDVTIEAVRPLLERELEGFGELFRWLSYGEIGARAMLSRAIAGVAAGKAIFALPGAPAAVRLAMEKLVLPAVGHLLGQARRADPPPAG